jgi:5'-methylthioadenosine phosphorylase
VAEPEIAIIGITAASSPLEDVSEVEAETPYGAPSAPISIGEIDGTTVAFLPRRGVEGQIPPPQIPYRANVWALKELGVRRILAPIVCGALKLDFELGDIVVCDQFVDRTWGREDTYYTGPGTYLVSAAQPFCDDLGTVLVRTARNLGFTVHHGGTTVVVQGPRFSTTAESLFFHAMGWDTVNMVSYPESHLARELELCYANISLVTDHDVGIAGAGGVTSLTVDRVLDESLARLRSLLRAAIPRIGPQPEDECATALARARL